MNVGRRSFLCMACLGTVLLVAGVPAHAQGNQLEISLDELIDDKSNGRVVARGNVEIRYFGEVLLADEVIYDRATRILTARGHIVLQEASGKVTQAEAIKLTDDLRNAFVAYARGQKVPIER